LALAVVRDLREQRSPRTDEELADDETDLLAGFVLARASAGLADGTIRNDTNHLELIRDWFDRPLWEMQPADADAYFGKVLRDAKLATRTGRAGWRCSSSSSSCATPSSCTTSPAVLSSARSMR
jgi:integrase/recombinase XerD